MSTPKVSIARRVALAANPFCKVEAVFGDSLEGANAHRLVDCDFLFLAADTMQTRLLFNAIVHQYYVPGIQVGAKVRAAAGTGDLLDVYSVTRTVLPDSGCLWCNGLISAEGLQREAATEEEDAIQRYVNDPTITAPSVITLNAIAAGHAANDFMFAMTGLTNKDATLEYMRFLPRERDVRFDLPRADPTCPECGLDPMSRQGRGDGVELPTRGG
jgi:hypothetical protein